MVIWNRSWLRSVMKLQTIGFFPSAADRHDLPGHRMGVGEGGGDEVDEDAVEPIVVEEHVQGRAELGAAGGGHHVDGVFQGRLGELGRLAAARSTPSESFGTSSPQATSTSVAMTAGPPVLVMMPTRFPAGIGWVAKAMAARIISPSSVKERMPVFSKISSVAISTPAREPVWEEAALAPCSVRPAFMASTGFRAATSRATSRNSCGSEKPFRVEHDGPGSVVITPIADDLGDGDVAGVAVGGVHPHADAQVEQAPA